ncbi:MAG TPA: type II secretion system F family protein [Candidatus Acidoferrales bacterium]|nr:type II secretion system F family protein [Candidatus Acidoferrales bacterium]
MPTYAVRGMTATGERWERDLTAASRSELEARLARERIRPMVIREKGREFVIPIFGGGVSAKEMSIFTRQLSTMIDAGLPLVQSLEILASQQDNKTFQKTLTGVRSAVESGSTLANALRQFPKVFDDLYTNMVEAGEAGGILDNVLQRLAVYIEKNVKLKAAVKSAMIYPTAVIAIMMLIVFALMKWVVPVFTKLFLDLGVPLPLPTRIVMNISFVVQSFWWLMGLGLIGAIFAVRAYYATPGGRYLIDSMLLRIPLIGILLRKVATARFCRTLGTLLSSGVPILDGLTITARTSGNAVIERALMAVRKAVEEGRTLVEPLKNSGVFPSMVSQMIGVGEQTGALDAMLSKIADFYEEEVDTAVKDLLTIMEPIILVMIGVIVGGIVISLYLPLFDLIGKLGS